MATVTTTFTLLGRRVPWLSQAPRAAYRGSQPLGKLIFTASGTIPAKGAADESEVIFTFTFPPNYFYRLLFFEWSSQGTASANFSRASGFEPEARCEISEAAVTAYQFPVQNRLMNDYVADNLTSIGSAKTQPDSVTNDFQAWYRAPRDISLYFIDASAAAVFEATWMDTSGGTTVAIPTQLRAEVLQYTIEQAQSWAPATPQLIFGN